MKKTMKIYTDGACPNNGKEGAIAGSGVYFCNDDGWNLSCPLPGEIQTNNRAEMFAIIVALHFVPNNWGATIYSDSKLCVKGCNEWMAGWKRRGWKTSKGQSVKNKDLWIDIDKLLATKNENIQFQWVKGHSRIKGNVEADRLAVMACESRYHPENMAKKRKRGKGGIFQNAGSKKKIRKE